MSLIECYDDYGKLVDIYNAPFDVEIDCYDVEVYGDDLSGMVLRGKCERLNFQNIVSYKEVDLSGFNKKGSSEITPRVTFASLLSEDKEKFNKYSNYTKFTAPLFGGFDGVNIFDYD